MPGAWSTQAQMVRPQCQNNTGLRALPTVTVRPLPAPLRAAARMSARGYGAARKSLRFCVSLDLAATPNHTQEAFTTHPNQRFTRTYWSSLCVRVFALCVNTGCLEMHGASAKRARNIQNQIKTALNSYMIGIVLCMRPCSEPQTWLAPSHSHSCQIGGAVVKLRLHVRARMSTCTENCTWTLR